MHDLQNMTSKYDDFRAMFSKCLQMATDQQNKIPSSIKTKKIMTRTVGLILAEI